MVDLGPTEAKHLRDKERPDQLDRFAVMTRQLMNEKLNPNHNQAFHTKPQPTLALLERTLYSDFSFRAFTRFRTLSSQGRIR